MDTIEQPGIVTATLVSDEQRMKTLPFYFGAKLTSAEMLVYQWIGNLCPGYSGGYWAFYALSNGGFYMAPTTDDRFTVKVDCNGYAGEMSADAAGVTACLFAFCQLANRTGSEQDRFIDLYHRLREFTIGHAEAASILCAID
jgi:hypothetical protein